MSFNWSEYFYLAEDLAGYNPSNQFSDEARYRAAISRAYYSAFLQAQDFLIQKAEFKVIPDDDDENRGSSHYRVIKAFRSGSSSRKKIGNDLLRIRHYRESADYHNIFRGNLISAVDETLELAEKIIKNLKILG